MVNCIEIVHTARTAFEKGRTKCLRFREYQLQNLLLLYKENRAGIEKSLMKDMKSCHRNTISHEIDLVIKNLKVILEEFKLWAASEELQDKTVWGIRKKSKNLKEPYGVVLLVSSWNHPLALGLIPLAGAIAAGNCVILKLSYISLATSELISELLQKYLNRECYHVVIGGVPVIEDLLREKWDYIFYSGPVTLEKIVLDRAKENSTPAYSLVIGKCPIYVDRKVDLSYAIQSILYGKFFGETFDYIICSNNLTDAILKIAQQEIKMLWNNDIKLKGRVFCEAHFWRLKCILSHSNIAVGGQMSILKKYIEPTILCDVKPLDPIMLEEHFGPILPILFVESVEGAVEFLRKWDKPQTLHIFSDDQQVVNILLENVCYGTVYLNNVMLPQRSQKSDVKPYLEREYFDKFTRLTKVTIREYNQLLECLFFGRYKFFKLAMMKISKSVHLVNIIHCLGFIVVGLVAALASRYFFRHVEDEPMLPIVEVVSEE